MTAGRIQPLLAVFRKHMDPPPDPPMPFLHGPGKTDRDRDGLTRDVRLGPGQFLLKRPFHEKYPPALD